MKRIFAFILAVVMTSALLCACGSNSSDTSKSEVKTSVSEKYNDGYADKYASTTSTDSDGNKVYEFSGEQYDDYVTNHKNSLSIDIQKELVSTHGSSYGEYVYINDDKKAVIVGIHEDEYDAATAETEAKSIAEYGFKHFQNLSTPVDTISVIYCNASNQDEVYGSFEFTAE